MDGPLTTDERDALNRAQFLTPNTLEDNPVHAAVERIVAARCGAAVAAALQDVADEWQQGGWANAPRRSDRIAERIANAQFVTDWLRDRIPADPKTTS